MAKAVHPRHGSMGVWPRVRSQREHAKIRSWIKGKEPKPVGFAGYKVGMAHVIAVDNNKNSKTKGQDLALPVTIVECPPIKVIGATFYKKDQYGLHAAAHVVSQADKFTKRAFPAAKKDTAGKFETLKPEDYTEIRLVVQTQPHLTTIGKKKPEVFELGLGGKVPEQFTFAKEKLGKEVALSEVFTEGQQVDIHAITTGKGYQGATKRFGLRLKSHKAEKGQRGPGAFGSWKGQAHTHYRIAKPGQMGYHQRLDLNKWVLKIDDNADAINQKEGFKRYGVVKNTYLLLKGSVPGPVKRLLKLTVAHRPRSNIPKEAPSINFVSTTAKAAN